MNILRYSALQGLILMSDIDEDITNSKSISFADDTRLYNSVLEVKDCDLLQVDLDTIC